MLGIIKGDNRYLYLSKMVESIISNKLFDLYNLDYLLLPFKGISLDGKISMTNLYLEDILKQNSIKIVFVGNTNFKLEELKDKYKFKVVEILKNERFILENALLTSKGIINYINSSENDISYYNILLLGYGNIGYYLADLLKCNQVNFDVLSYSDLERKYIILNNYNYVNNINKNYDIIINTIPKNQKFDFGKLTNTKILDVSSSPYGFLKDDIIKYNLDYVILSAIPAKFAPNSAAKILKNLIVDVITS